MLRTEKNCMSKKTVISCSDDSHYHDLILELRHRAGRPRVPCRPVPPLGDTVAMAGGDAHPIVRKAVCDDRRDS